MSVGQCIATATAVVFKSVADLVTHLNLFLCEFPHNLLFYGDFHSHIMFSPIQSFRSMDMFSTIKDIIYPSFLSWFNHPQNTQITKTWILSL